MDIELSPKKRSTPSVHKAGQTGTDNEDQPNSGDSESGKIMARIGCLPCQHASARGLHDQSATLWASWSVESGGKKVWFAG